MNAEDDEDQKLMTEDTSNPQVTTGEPGRITGYVKNKIRSIKTAAPVARARKGEKSQVSTYVAKVYKKAAQIADLMTGEDVEEDLRVLREARHAVHHIYDQKQKCLIPVPDHKTRLAATTLSRAYHEGKPIERTISASGDFEDLQSLLEAMKNSPAAQASLQKTVEGREIPPALADAATEEGSGHAS
jgi:hypothetical protein